MYYFEFRYSLSIKTYYDDGHDGPEIDAYHKQYVTKHLQNEFIIFAEYSFLLQRLRRWKKILVSLIEQLAMNISAVKWSCLDEFHVDDDKSFHINFDEKLFGGNLSGGKMMKIDIS